MMVSQKHLSIQKERGFKERNSLKNGLTRGRHFTRERASLQTRGVAPCLSRSQMSPEAADFKKANLKKSTVDRI